MADDEDWTEYRLTVEEFSTILHALRYAEDNAVHPDGQIRFREAKNQLVQQSDHHAVDKTTEHERFAGEADD